MHLVKHTPYITRVKCTYNRKEVCRKSTFLWSIKEEKKQLKLRTCLSLLNWQENKWISTGHTRIHVWNLEEKILFFSVEWNTWQFHPWFVGKFFFSFFIFHCKASYHPCLPTLLYWRSVIKSLRLIFSRFQIPENVFIIPISHRRWNNSESEKWEKVSNSQMIIWWVKMSKRYDLTVSLKWIGENCFISFIHFFPSCFSPSVSKTELLFFPFISS